MRALVTGSRGFVGSNLVTHLRERQGVEVLEWHRDSAPGALGDLVASADIVFHLAGINRPKDPAEFAAGNGGITEQVVAAARRAGRRVPIVLSSSTQAALDNPYGQSKRLAEDAVIDYALAEGAACSVYRLPNVFGKWSLPNYNSAVATFCHNVSRGLPITVNDRSAPLRLVYVDDVCRDFLGMLDAPRTPPADPEAVRREQPLEPAAAEGEDALEVGEGLRGLRVEVADADELARVRVDRGLPGQDQHAADPIAERDVVRREPVALAGQPLRRGAVEHVRLLTSG